MFHNSFDNWDHRITFAGGFIAAVGRAEDLLSSLGHLLGVFGVLVAIACSVRREWRDTRDDRERRTGSGDRRKGSRQELMKCQQCGKGGQLHRDGKGRLLCWPCIDQMITALASSEAEG